MLIRLQTDPHCTDLTLRLNGEACALSARTMLGGVLGLVPVPTDSRPSYARSTQHGAIAEPERHAVQFLVVDNAARSTFEAMQPAFPCLRCIDSEHVTSPWTTSPWHPTAAPLRR